MAISVHHRKVSLRNYIGRPSSEKIRGCSDILSDALSGKSHQSLQPSFAALPSRAIFMFRWIRLSFIQKTLALNSLFSTLSCEKTRVFLWAIIRLKFTEHFTSRFCIRDLKTSGESVKFDLPNYFWFVNYRRMWTLMVMNFDGLTLLTALVLYSQLDYLNHSNRDSDWLVVACFMRVWSMLSTLLFALEMKFVLKIESNA